MRLFTSICAAVLIGPFTVASAYHAQMQQVSEDSVPTGWSKVDAGAFFFFAPSGWQFRQLRGVDSYVGEFTGDGIMLRFDFGGYSNSFKEEKKPRLSSFISPSGDCPPKQLAQICRATESLASISRERLAQINSLCSAKTSRPLSRNWR
jgi:hypothetical protein